MRITADRIRRMIAALALAAAVGAPTAGADPSAALPPLTSSGAGPIIGGGSAAAQGISQQLFSFGNPSVVQEVDGSDAVQFITAAASGANTQLAAPFSVLRRGLACQPNNAGFGARAFRRNDGQWGGAMLVAAKSAAPDIEGCEKTNWRRGTAGSQTSVCNSGWATPNNFSRREGETYYILLAGTADDFCTDLNGKFKNNAVGWPF
jgi:hypothetical protein